LSVKTRGATTNIERTGFVSSKSGTHAGELPCLEFLSPRAELEYIRLLIRHGDRPCSRRRALVRLAQRVQTLRAFLLFDGGLLSPLEFLLMPLFGNLLSRPDVLAQQPRSIPESVTTGVLRMISPWSSLALPIGPTPRAFG